MNKRPGTGSNGQGDANGNGNGNGNGKGALNGKALNGKALMRTEISSRRLSPRPPVRKSASALPVLLVLCAVAIVGIGLAIVSQAPLILPPASSPVPSAEVFRLGVNRAISAAAVTQTATSQTEWQTIAAWWEEAVTLMKQVPSFSPNIAVAQSRIPAYEDNLTYAKQRAERSPQSQFSRALWSKGVRRAEVIRIQGNPTQTERYDALCKELLYYGRSTVELNNGIVVRAEDIDRNLRISTSQAPIFTTLSTTDWTLDSPKEDLFRIQGTPTRIIRYDSSRKDALYYGDSTVYLSEDRVVGYDNLTNNLKVTVTPSSSGAIEAWSINSPRDDIFRVQGTPTHVSLDATSCSETLQYSGSTIELRNGFVAGYDDIDHNLRVRIK
jgi:hypothetical protein